jgi:hypothetical protein
MQNKTTFSIPSPHKRTPMTVRGPTDPKYVPWLEVELPNYREAVKYTAWFFEQRSLMGDMETTDLWAEFKQNVCLEMRDRAGTNILE